MRCWNLLKRKRYSIMGFLFNCHKLVKRSKCRCHRTLLNRQSPQFLSTPKKLIYRYAQLKVIINTTLKKGASPKSSIDTLNCTFFKHAFSLRLFVYLATQWKRLMDFFLLVSRFLSVHLMTNA